MLDIVAEINDLKKTKNATILAHYYQEGEIQDLADATRKEALKVVAGKGGRLDRLPLPVDVGEAIAVGRFDIPVHRAIPASPLWTQRLGP